MTEEDIIQEIWEYTDGRVIAESVTVAEIDPEYEMTPKMKAAVGRLIGSATRLYEAAEDIEEALSGSKPNKKVAAELTTLRDVLDRIRGE